MSCLGIEGHDALAFRAGRRAPLMADGDVSRPYTVGLLEAALQFGDLAAAAARGGDRRADEVLVPTGKQDVQSEMGSQLPMQASQLVVTSQLPGQMLHVVAVQWLVHAHSGSPVEPRTQMPFCVGGLL